MLQLLFWLSFALLAWSLVGYPAWMIVYARLRPRPPAPRPGGSAPPVTVVVAVRNEAARIEARLRNLLTECRVDGALEVIVACNGCTDGTEAVVDRVAASDPRVRRLTSPPAEGKAGALNRGVEAAQGEVVVFADARQRFEPDAVRRLLAPFADPAVGAVTGRLRLERSSGDGAGQRGLRSYWELETRLRMAESETGSVVGATGAIYAVRRELHRPLPAGVILDDVFTPMQIAMGGRRVVMAPDAVAWDSASPTQRQEYERRVRTLLGNVELLRLLPGLLSPRRNPILLRYLFHQLLRLALPLFLLGMLASALLLPGVLYQAFALAGVLVLLLGGAGLALGLRALSIPAAFVLLQAAVLAAVLRPRRTASHVWVR